MTNGEFQDYLAPRSYFILDESIMKPFHQKLKGKLKIICKPRPTGNKTNNLCNAALILS